MTAGDRYLDSFPSSLKDPTQKVCFCLTRDFACSARLSKGSEICGKMFARMWRVILATRSAKILNFQVISSRPCRSQQRMIAKRPSFRTARGIRNFFPWKLFPENPASYDGLLKALCNLPYFDH